MVPACAISDKLMESLDIFNIDLTFMAARVNPAVQQDATNKSAESCNRGDRLSIAKVANHSLKRARSVVMLSANSN